MIDVKEYNLGDDIEFLSYADEEEWHALRKEGIGGSDAGAVLGLNKYTSPLKLYRTKKGVYKEDADDNVYIKKGKDLENLIFEKYVKKDPELEAYNVIHPEHVFVNKQYPWLRANCDGLAVHPGTPSLMPSHIVIEIKWVSEWAEVNWDGDAYCGIPASYYAQVQHYMLVTGAKRAYLYALFDRDWKCKRYTIPFNLTFAIKLIAETQKFYNNLVTDKEPAVTATLDKEFLPEELSKMPVVTKESEELDEAIANYLSLKEEIKHLETEMDLHYNKAVALYMDGYRPAGPFKMDISACKKSGFDAKQFAANHPEVYEQYKTTTEYTRTVMKRK